MTTVDSQRLLLRALAILLALSLIGLFLLINPQALLSSLVYEGY